MMMDAQAMMKSSGMMDESGMKMMEAAQMMMDGQKMMMDGQAMMMKVAGMMPTDGQKIDDEIARPLLLVHRGCGTLLRGHLTESRSCSLSNCFNVTKEAEILGELNPRTPSP